MGEEIKGIVFDIKRYTLHDGPGIRVAVHLKGCPLSCLWCHNPESQSFLPRVLFRSERCVACGGCAAQCPQGAVTFSNGAFSTDADLCKGDGTCARVCPSGAKEMCGREMTLRGVMAQISKERIFFDQSGGGVTLSGGEPLSQPDFAAALLRECRRREIRTAVDTCGFVSRSALMDILPFTDLFLYDIKHMDPETHRRYTGADNEVILSNLAALGEAGAIINARMPFIPGFNADAENLRATGGFLSKIKGVVKLNLLPYHAAAEDKHRRWDMEYRAKGARPPTDNELREAAAVMESFGLDAEIGG